MASSAHLDIPPALLALLGDIPRRYPVRKIWLFGSRARGDHAPKADIDLAFEVPDMDVVKWMDMVEEIDASTLLKIDCVDWRHTDEALRHNILRDGIVIHDES